MVYHDFGWFYLHFTIVLPSFLLDTSAFFREHSADAVCHKGLAAVLRNGAGVPLDADGAERRVGGTDQNGWFIGENPIYKWMITRGTGYPLF